MNYILQGTKAKVNPKQPLQSKEKPREKPKPLKASKKQQRKEDNKVHKLEKKDHKEQKQSAKQIKIQPSPIQKAAQVTTPPAEPKKQAQVRMVIVRYSHYKSKFQALDNFLTFRQIDKEYSLSFVFRGNFQPVLKPIKDPRPLPYSEGGWTLSEHDQYQLQILQDEQAQAQVERRAYVAPKVQSSKKGRVEELTAELKGLTEEELRSKGQNYRRLIQQRDLQDILFK